MQLPHVLSILTALILQSLAITLPVPNFTKPTIVLVPGAWHSPEHYSTLQLYLKRLGFDVISQRNPSCNSKTPNFESAAKDAAAIRDMILPLIDAGKIVVVASHSYGGSPGAAAAKGLSQSERRAAGQPGGILGFISICALLAHEGQSFLSVLSGQNFYPWVLQKV